MDYRLGFGLLILKKSSYAACSNASVLRKNILLATSHWKGIQVEFFTIDQNIGKSLKCIFTKFELSSSCRFQNIAVQS